VLASITLGFDAQANLFGTDFRLETLAIALVLFAALALAGLLAGRPGAGLFERRSETGGAIPGLRRDDLLLIAFGVVPGAVAGGRLDYVLVHLDYYRTHTDAILDVSQGGLNLTLAVVLGAISGLLVAKLMNAPLRRWLAVLAVPAMFALGFGKLATVLGGAGQGSYSDSAWATSYTGRGPWESLNPTYPAIPSQALEGLLVLTAMLAVVVVPSLLRFRLRRWRRFVRPGLAPRHPWSLVTGWRRFLTAIGLWAAMRLAAAFTWRDASVAGPLNAEQVMLAGVVAIAALGPAAFAATVWSVRGLSRGVASGVRALQARRAARRGDMDVAKLQIVADAKGRAPTPTSEAAPPIVHEIKPPIEDA
jgi:prolipoprotein diacylglyceryltransferase